jgi:hypothetical protein
LKRGDDNVTAESINEFRGLARQVDGDARGKARAAALNRLVAHQYPEQGCGPPRLLPGFVDNPMLRISETKPNSAVRFRPGTSQRKADPARSQM